MNPKKLILKTHEVHCWYVRAALQSHVLGAVVVPVRSLAGIRSKNSTPQDVRENVVGEGRQYDGALRHAEDERAVTFDEGRQFTKSESHLGLPATQFTRSPHLKDPMRSSVAAKHRQCVAIQGEGPVANEICLVTGWLGSEGMQANSFLRS